MVWVIVELPITVVMVCVTWPEPEPDDPEPEPEPEPELEPDDPEPELDDPEPEPEDPELEPDEPEPEPEPEPDDPEPEPDDPEPEPVEPEPDPEPEVDDPESDEPEPEEPCPGDDGEPVGPETGQYVVYVTTVLVTTGAVVYGPMILSEDASWIEDNGYLQLVTVGAQLEIVIICVVVMVEVVIGTELVLEAPPDVVDTGPVRVAEVLLAVDEVSVVLADPVEEAELDEDTVVLSQIVIKLLELELEPEVVVVKTLEVEVPVDELVSVVLLTDELSVVVLDPVVLVVPVLVVVDGGQKTMFGFGTHSPVRTSPLSPGATT